ncbi:hypothetical protein [Kitasatospora phosalacinea]|uniref:HhH-GPD domain-containing protein n=1 Tax=Kitasatospora phosalacinea TaxID=2065 RepID=A0ABW6GQ92_9ACTN
MTAPTAPGPACPSTPADPAADPAALLAAHVVRTLGDGPFPPPAGWTHMGAVICDAAFQPRRNYLRQVRPALLRLVAAWPEATTVSAFRARTATEDLAAAMTFRSPRRVATARGLADLLAAHGVETRADLHAWLDAPAHRAALRRVPGVGPKTVDYLANLVGRSHVAVDTHLRAFAAGAGLPELGYEGLRAAYERAADALGHDRAGLEHAVWRHGAHTG